MTSSSKPKILVTGISGNLGRRLLRQLDDFEVIGVDFVSPPTESSLVFEKLDLGQEASCHELVQLLRKHDVRAVVHLAFVIDPLQTGVLDVDRMWQINVAGTARVMEAVTEVNRNGGLIDTFIFPSSVSAYGPETPGPVTEDHALNAHTLPYAIHKKEADDVARFRAPALGKCTSYILRPHIFAGATVENYMIGALRGTPTGRGRLAQRWRDKGVRLPLVLPVGEKYLRKRFQFVHVDDMARLISFLLRQSKRKNEMVVMNVAGRGDSVAVQQCVEIANQKLVRLPTKALCRLTLRTMWNMGISGVPPEAFAYMSGSYTMDTSRLRQFLGKDYEHVIQHTIEEALRDSFHAPEVTSVSEHAQAAH